MMMKTFKALLWFVIPFCAITALLLLLIKITLYENLGLRNYLPFLLENKLVLRALFNIIKRPMVLITLATAALCVGRYSLREHIERPVLKRFFYPAAFFIFTVLFYLPNILDARHIDAVWDSSYKPPILNITLLLLSMLIGNVCCFIIWIIDKLMCKLTHKC